MRIVLPAALAAVVLLAAVTTAGAVSGGRRADIARMPFVAKIGGCTGTLIAPDRVLTAAHCIDGVEPAGTSLVVGADPGRDPAAPRLAIRGFSVAPGYRLSFPFARNSPANAIAVDDVALVLLVAPLTNVKPVAIAGPGDKACHSSRLAG